MIQCILVYLALNVVYKTEEFSGAEMKVENCNTGVKDLPSLFVDVWDWITLKFGIRFSRQEPYKRKMVAGTLFRRRHETFSNKTPTSPVSSNQMSSLCMELPTKSGTGSEGRVSESVCEQTNGQENWKVCLDVSPFSPEEINIKTKDGYLEIKGNHEERQENHRLISRSFTRKYKLPADLDLKQISSMLSPDGVLSIEAPLPGSNISLPGEIVIPIHMMDKQSPAKSDELCLNEQVQYKAAWTSPEDCSGGSCVCDCGHLEKHH
ncbi:hypothetical protein QQF64_027921 [Cirrhinus molitorella]|uniref:SHSP domain-containing protein n=1 Tax=Cirrhinus molitorella TaxID=172907 RepID=A0ABR3NE35_9TELE